MTRKRFVKLLMAEGFSRNSTNKIAEDVLKDGLTYAEGYDHVLRLLPAVQDILPKIAEAIPKVIDAVQKLAKIVAAAAEATKAFNDTFQAAMSRT